MTAVIGLDIASQAQESSTQLKVTYHLVDMTKQRQHADARQVVVVKLPL